MTMKIISAFLLCLSVFSQETFSQEKPSPAPVVSALPTYVGAGVTYNQIGTPKANIWATAIYPVISSVGVYSSTSTDIVPVQKLDPATGRAYFAFTTSIRQGVHKTVYTSGKFVALIGGDAGVGLSQAVPSGMNVSLAASFTATAIYQLTPKFAVVVPIRGMWVNSSWNLLPQIGILFRP